MKVLPDQETYLREKIRTALALDPLVTIRHLQEIIRRSTGSRHTISDKYLMKLLHKVRRQIVFESDRKKVSTRLTEVRERYAELSKELYLIIYWRHDYFALYGIRRPKASERTHAVKVVAQMDLALLRAELDVGLYEDRRLALEEMLRSGLLPQELHEQIVAVFRTYKMHPSPVQTKVITTAQ